MMLLNTILLAFNLVLVPIALMLGWLRGYDEADRANMMIYEAEDQLERSYAKLGKSVYEILIKEDDHEQG